MSISLTHVSQYEAKGFTFTGALGITERSQKRQEEERMHSVWVESLEQVRREDEWFKAANRGKDEDIEKMQDLIGEDPNRFYGDWDPRKLINSVDSKNRTALYLAGG
ncbi:hypothetical protein WA538_000665 [Blastocystis sp. DL]